MYCHADEVGHAKREYLEQVSVLDLALRIWRPRWAVWTAHVVRSGGLIRDGIPTTQPLTPEVAAGLPGHPKPVFSPGHTNGHCSYLVDGVLASGDALITGHPLLRHDGPQLLPAIFSYSQENCIRSLSALAAAGDRGAGARPRPAVARPDPRSDGRGPEESPVALGRQAQVLAQGFPGVLGAVRVALLQ